MELLPDDLLLELASHLTIDDFLRFRLVSRQIRDLLESSIAGVAEQVARNTFPAQQRIILRSKSDVADVKWLGDLRYRQLAAIVVERHAGISAEDPLGDRVRNKIYLGWKAFGRLAQIAYEVRILPAIVRPPTTPANFMHPSVYDLRKGKQWKMAVHSEQEISVRWLKFIGTLGLEAMQGLRHLWQVIFPVILHPYPQNSLGEDQDRFESPVHGQLFSMVSWSTWTLLNAGPNIFWRAWVTERSSEPANTVLADWIHARWRCTDRLLGFVQAAMCKHIAEDNHQRMRTRIYRAVSERYPEQRPYERVSAITDTLAQAIRPLVARRAMLVEEHGEPEIPHPLRSVQFQQHLRFDELGLERLPSQHVIRCFFGYGGGPPTPSATELWDKLQAFQRWEDDILEDISQGRFVLPS